MAELVTGKVKALSLSFVTKRVYTVNKGNFRGMFRGGCSLSHCILFDCIAFNDPRVRGPLTLFS